MASHDPSASQASLCLHNPLALHDSFASHDSSPSHAPLCLLCPLGSHGSFASQDFSASHVPLGLHGPLASHDPWASHDILGLHSIFASHDSLASHDSMASQDALGLHGTLTSYDFLASQGPLGSHNSLAPPDPLVSPDSASFLALAWQGLANWQRSRRFFKALKASMTRWLRMAQVLFFAWIYTAPLIAIALDADSQHKLIFFSSARGTATPVFRAVSCETDSTHANRLNGLNHGDVR
eukprot:CAMPEP_0205867370 /NCGR_PEP_ID=MMETSP1083-20121108/8918_1 /ASSEMBLY_ACC=CAM_ASM_000430 /TAXON_ID=97485 /ORGANISM="Prymnesium parvum, Strain Texoma1" /LENGTH=237 /DNA_ID=CAMNT_0053229439 /DNA_START=425 /DNA_END=1139 /DNA_ORIENTATION=+